MKGQQHKLLQRQLKKHSTEVLLENPNFMEFIDAVNESYETFERDKVLSDHAYKVSQQDFDDINKKLKQEIDLKKVSIGKLKDTLSNIKSDDINKTQSEASDDDLLEILDLLNAEIAKRKEAETQALFAKEEAEKASHAKSDFLSIMSHEIRTPLNAVIGMGHLLLKNNPREDQINNLKALNTSSANLLVLINDILDFNKIEAGKIELEEEEFSIKKLVTDIVAANDNSANERQNKLILKIDEKLPNHFIGDSLRLGQVLNNLISNAIKFTQNGTINVSLTTKEIKESKAFISFSIEDTGVGIDTEKLNTIFLPFTQASTSITRKFGGTGLGLAITKRILELFKSDIKIKSIEGVGSTFYFDLELETLISDKSNYLEDIAIDFDLKEKHILLVEDTLFNVLFATQLLNSWNAKVDVAENGEMAVEMALKGNFDLILMDLQMPIMDGFTATTKIREQNKFIPIIALTASATSNVKQRVLAVGMQDYVTKPFNPNDFYLRLKKYLI